MQEIQPQRIWPYLQKNAMATSPDSVAEVTSLLLFRFDNFEQHI